MRVLHIAESCLARLWVGGPTGAPDDIPEVRAGVAGNDEAPAAALRFVHRKNDLARFLHLSFSNMNLNMHQ